MKNGGCFVMRTAQAKSAKAEKTLMIKWFKPLIIGTAAFLTILTILLMILSFLLMNKDFSDTMLFIVTCVVLALAALAGGYVTARISKERGLVMGGILGFIAFAVMSIVSTVLTKAGFGTAGFIKLLLCLLPAALGGFFGVNRKKRRK